MDDAITDIKKLTQAIEAILFAAGHAVSYEKLSAVLGLPPREIRQLAEHMALDYNGEDSPRGLLLLCQEDCCQLCTKEEYAPYIREALGIRRGGNLSASSLEVLAVVAYNQPVTRSYIDAVRGVDSAYAVSSLLDRRLIEPCGRLDAPGRPMLYATTPDFLRVFGLSSLADLPDSDALALASATKFEQIQQEGTEPESTEEAAEAETVSDASADAVPPTSEEPSPDTPSTDAPNEPAIDSLPDPEDEQPEGAIDAASLTGD